MSGDGIHYRESGTAFVGTDAVQCFAAYTLVSAINLYVRSGIRASRFHTPGNMLAKAEEITGKRYGRATRKKLEQAAVDVKTWADNMKAALPKTDENGEAIP